MSEKTLTVEKFNEIDPIFQRVVDAQMSLKYANMVRDCSEETPKLPKLAEFIDKVHLEGQAGPMVDQTNTTEDGPTISLDRAKQAIKSGEVKSLWSDKELLEMYFDPGENPDYDPETGEAVFNAITQSLPGAKHDRLNSYVAANLRNLWGKAKQLADEKYYMNHPKQAEAPALEITSLSEAKNNLKTAITNVRLPVGDETQQREARLSQNAVEASIYDLARSVASEPGKETIRSTTVEVAQSDAPLLEIATRHLADYALEHLNQVDVETFQGVAKGFSGFRLNLNSPDGRIWQTSLNIQWTDGQNHSTPPTPTLIKEYLKSISERAKKDKSVEKVTIVVTDRPQALQNS